MWVLLIAAASGIWLMISPAVFGYVGSGAAMNDRIVGPLIATFAIVAMGESTRSVRWWNLPLAAWMVIAAFVLGYPGWGAIAGVLAAAIAALLPAFLATPQPPNYAGGWAVLWKKDPYNTREGSADRPANPDAERRPA